MYIHYSVVTVWVFLIKKNVYDNKPVKSSVFYRYENNANKIKCSAIFGWHPPEYDRKHKNENGNAQTYKLYQIRFEGKYDIDDSTISLFFSFSRLVSFILDLTNAIMLLICCYNAWPTCGKLEHCALWRVSI